MTITRRELLMSAAFAGGVALSGCSHGINVNGRQLITQWYHQYGEEGTHNAVLRYAAQYTQENPHIIIKVVWVPGDYSTKLSTALLTPNGPDVFETQLTTPMVEAGQVAQLDDLYTADARHDFAKASQQVNTVDGHIYGVQELIDTALLYYRKSLLSNSGIGPPTTFDELLTAAKKLTSPDRKGIFLGNDSGITAMLNILPWSAGSDFLVNNQIVFDSDRTAATFDALKSLSDSGAMLIGAPTDYWDPAALIQGLTAMQWTGLWAYPALHRAFGEDLAAIPWPKFDISGTPTTFTGGWSSMVNAQSRHVTEAKKYVKWLWIDNTAAQRDWCLNYGFHIPARTSIAERSVVLRSGVPAVAVSAVRQFGRFLPPLWNSAMTTALTDAATNIVKLGQPSRAALSQAARVCRRELSRALE